MLLNYFICFILVISPFTFINEFIDSDSQGILLKKSLFYYKGYYLSVIKYYKIFIV